MNAAACTCVAIDPWDAYARSDAAIVGVYAGKRGLTTYVFQVEEDYKVELPAELEVESAESGPSCGIEARVGQRLGLFLTRTGDRWRSNLCSQARPAQIRVAARGLPRPNGKGPVRFLVGGSFGPARVQALDASGRTLAYGYGPGRAVAVAVCPGARRIVEVTAAPAIAVRDLGTLRIVRQHRLRLRDHEFPGSVACDDPAGRRSFLFVWRASSGRILRLRGSALTSIYSGPGTEAAFAGPFAYVAGVGRGVVRVDLADGRTRLVMKAVLDRAPAVSPDGRRLATVTQRGELALVDLVRQKTRLGPRVGAATQAVWIDARRVAWLADSGEVLVSDTAFRKLGRFDGWRSTAAVAAGERLVGVAHGALRSARLPRGPVRMLRDLISPATDSLTVVRAGPRIRLAGRLACARG